MVFDEIKNRFSEIVNSWVAKGFWIDKALTKEDPVFKPTLDFTLKNQKGEEVEIIQGENRDCSSRYCEIYIVTLKSWDNKPITETFYLTNAFGFSPRVNHFHNWYCTEDEIAEVRKKHEERRPFCARNHAPAKLENRLSKEAVRRVWRQYIKTKPGYESTRLKNIVSIIRQPKCDHSRFEYVITIKNKKPIAVS